MKPASHGLVRKLCRGLTVLFALLLAPGASAQSVLNFSFASGISNDSPIGTTNYGDNISAATMGTFNYGGGSGYTPNVTLDYNDSSSTPANLTWWEYDYSGLTGVLTLKDQRTSFSLTFTAESGYEVTLQSLQIGGYQNFNTLITSVTVKDETNASLYYSTAPYGPLWNTTAYNLNFGAGVTGQTLTLTFDFTGNLAHSNMIGLDNITFSQTAVPEPSAYAALAGLAMLGFAVWRRKESRVR